MTTMEAATGARLLGEVEEASLEEMLQGVRSALTLALEPTSPGNRASTQGHIQAAKSTHMQPLDQLAARRFQATKAAGVSLSGRHLPLLYKLISTLVSPPHLHALLVIDLDGRFDTTRLTCVESNLRHVYVQRPARSNTERLRAVVAEAEGFMLYGNGAHASTARQWWGTVVVGGLGAGDIAAGWKGWLRVDREHIRGFTIGISAEEAMEQRGRRQDAVDGAGWAATSEWGGFSFKEIGGRDEDDESHADEEESRV
ncbi:hypothetical protein BGZ61DRAFT_241129 [Ilyonectria robusta]|uniref:uncharacterized protein n=1 Tax=Ilyonectria robusta TaxID=1079257 RepID=UPI001E8D6B26|nr:uncharacterized protein BGZ61DRAFT_241129 [Ilyonectria robusta]KAH8699994.1 hypothetical protein BGZ61DRAFT_241129 [Ilyonectria robusta]